MKLKNIFVFEIIFFVIFGLSAQEFSPLYLLSKFEIPVQRKKNQPLKIGHEEFQTIYYQQNEERFLQLIKDGQMPKILFIGCSDARVVPEIILKTHPGEVFVIRTEGNFVPPYSPWTIDGVAATVQYATEILEIPHIIICGHSHCSAIYGLFHQLSPRLEILRHWLSLGEKAKRFALLAKPLNAPIQEIYSTTEKISVLLQMDNLMSYPFVKRRVHKGTLEVHGWYYDVKTEELSYYRYANGQFVPFSGIH